MMRLGSLIRHLFPHRAWPYPRGEREIRQVIVVTLCLVLLTLIGIIIGLEYDNNKTLQSSDIHFAAKNVTSYSSEAYLIATQSQQQPVVGSYRQVYVQQLADNVSTVTDKLATHQVATKVQPYAAKLKKVCDRLTAILNSFSRNPTDHVFAEHAQELHQLADKAQAIEDSL